MPRKPSDIVQYKLRIRESLRRRIEKAAEKNQTSANSEMANRLEASFRQEGVDELSALVMKATRVFSLVDVEAWIKSDGRHGLVHAASALVLQVLQLPDEIKNRPGLKEAVEQINRYL
jgi:chemotaxis methyl-accepting protein methylase